jgi:DNA invertase Pin-like site-specific DNA recombinase
LGQGRRESAGPAQDLSRSLMDFAKLVEVFDRNNVTFVSVTQCRLTLNILLSFAQFEPEVIGERIRDKFAALPGSPHTLPSPSTR